MAASMKTPGVYVVEKDAFPSSVVGVATDVPAFIGHTEKAEINGKPLTNQAVRLTSLTEYIELFGEAPKTTYKVVKQEANPNIIIRGEGYEIAPQAKDYGFFNSLQLFFQNGGGSCYIVSVGNYEEEYDLDRFRGGLNVLIKEQEPTIIVIPEAVKLPFDSCNTLQQAMLDHCGGKMKNRVAILDIYDGYLPRLVDKDPVADFRNAIGTNFLDYSMAYYPWVHTTIVQDSSLSYETIDPESVAELSELMAAELITPLDDELAKLNPDDAEDAVRKVTLENLKNDYQGYIDELNTGNDKDGNPLTEVGKNNLNKALLQLSPSFGQIISEIRTQMNLLPPSSAMAGVYTMVDNERGVWQAPANVSLSSVIQPSVDITHAEQEDLNVTPQGTSVNAIRSFVGEGTLVWGARTLDGNSLDWRYIQVRRTIIMLEESIKLASKAYVFDSNTANTWTAMRDMIGNFLMGIWKRQKIFLRVFCESRYVLH